MKINRSTLTLAVLISVALVLTAYTLSAYHAASFVHEKEGRLAWPSTPGGSFYPWPSAPTGIQGMMMCELNEADSQYYRYIIKPGILVALTLLLWAIVFWRVWRKRNFHCSK